MRIVARLLVLLPLLWVEGVWALDCPQYSYNIREDGDMDEIFYSGCTRILGDLSVGSGPDIRNLDALRNLTTIDGKLIISNNEVLTNIDGLANLTSVGGILSAQDNNALHNLDGLKNLASVGSLLIEGNEALANLNGLANITSVKDLFLFRLAAITKLHGLANLTSVGNLMWIRDNDALTNLDFLANLTSVGFRIQISRNDALTNLDRLKKISFDRLSIDYNPVLTNLDFLAGVASFDEVIIAGNEALTNIDGLASLTSVGGYLSLSDNDVLPNLDGLANLTSVGDGLYIRGNDTLTNIDGLASLTSVGGDLELYDNDAVATCRGVAQLLGWPDGPPEDDVTGDITVNSNGTACSSVQQVLDSVSLPTQPVINQRAIAGASVSLGFIASKTTETSWPITGYGASCTGSDVDVSGSPATELLDNAPVQETLTVSGYDPTSVPSAVELDIDITHSDPTDLYITLTTPQGTELVLWNQGSAGGEDLVGTFPTTLTPVDSLDSVATQSMDGDWMLSIADIDVGPVVREGVLNSWRLRITEELVNNASGSPIEVFGATQGRDYSCTVAPITKLGAIPLSAPVTVSESSLQSPLAPTINSIEYDNGKIILTVSVSDSGGTEITGYDATCTDGTNTYTGSSTSSPITVSGLTNGVAYTCTVTATNAVGTSAASPSTAPIIPSPSTRVVLEEPVMDETHTGVGNLRGWAISADGIDKVEIYIDGSYAFDAPYGGERTDVRDAFPDVEGSTDSGFSLAFNYSNLSSGVHTISAVAHSGAGEMNESMADFEVVRFDSSFISDPNAVDLSLGSCSFPNQWDEVALTSVMVDDSQHDLVMKWRTAEQGFELIQINKSDEENAEAAPAVVNAQQSNFVAQSDSVMRIVLEEPLSEEIHTGVGNLRGWAIADEGIEKVEIYIDGAYAFDAPYGGERTDVRNAFPDVEGSADSGFSLAFNYSNLSSGGHTITAIAYDRFGVTKESSAEFTVVRFDSSFINNFRESGYGLRYASCRLEADEVSLNGVWVNGALLDLVLKWRPAEQGFEIVEIR